MLREAIKKIRKKIGKIFGEVKKSSYICTVKNDTTIGSLIGKTFPILINKFCAHKELFID